jgi:hypothetical protein
MDGQFSFCVSFSGLTVRFIFSAPVSLSDRYCALRCADTAKPDAEYRIVLLDEPLPLDGAPVHQEEHTLIYHTHKGWLRIYSALTGADGCQVACLFCPDGRHTLYLPASQWDVFAKHWSIADLLAGEKLLIQHDAFLLHSSVVEIHGKSVLFSAPSGVGKSTQANLWAEHLGATILNGDRAVIRHTDGGFTAAGSFWSGTSGIYVPRQAPIAGIILLEQAPENAIEPVGVDAFKALLSETTVNTWDPAFMGQITDLICDVMTQVPIYRLRCRPDKAAAELVYQTLFGKERSACKS